MANTKKPNTFPQNALPLQGTEEIYSQEGGVNTKYTVQDIWNGVTQTTTTVNSGTTIINNSIVNIASGTTLISGGTTNLGTGSTLVSGSTSSVVDNGDGTYTHNDNSIPNTSTVIKPVDYDNSELATGQLWIDSKPIYRRVIQLAQWTVGGEEDGQYLLGTGQTFDSCVRLDFYAKEDGGTQIRKMNIGSGTTWTGGGYLSYDTSDSYIVWENIYDPTEIPILEPTVYIIIEYTKP